MRAPLVAVVVVTVLSGCTARAPSPAGDAASPAASASSPDLSTTGTATTGVTPTPVVPPPPPKAACYRLGSAELTRPTHAGRPVPCSRRHTALTIHVGRLEPAAAGGRLAVDSPAVQKHLAETCPRRLAAFVGGSRRQRDLSRLAVVWFGPTLQEADAGARWFRCDLVAFDRGATLLALPGARRLRGVLDRTGALDAYGLCGTTAPGAAGFQRVACARRHSWRAIDTLALEGRSYPGARGARRAGDAACKAEARSRAENTLSFRYGWEWPTAAQWRAGQRFGYCWAPERGPG
ncbi:MAG TPA: septum formation family protein [Nocardioidaceae bacterium]|nr:septum formation family protein [Nocardioidaceae bacterium]